MQKNRIEAFTDGVYAIIISMAGFPKTAFAPLDWFRPHGLYPIMYLKTSMHKRSEQNIFMNKSWT